MKNVGIALERPRVTTQKHRRKTVWTSNLTKYLDLTTTVKEMRGNVNSKGTWGWIQSNVECIKFYSTEESVSSASKWYEKRGWSVT